MRFIRTLTAGAAGVLLSAAAAYSAPADVASFYKGKTMTIYIGVSAGGGYDAYARMLSRHIVRHIPGNPRMIAKNYTGASGLRMVNALYNVFPQDGTSIAHIGRSLISEPLLGNKGAKFDGSKLQWLGSFNSENSMCTFWHKSKIKIWDADSYDVSRASLEAFATAAGGGPPYPIPLEQMIHGAAVTETIVKSAASGRMEKVF